MSRIDTGSDAPVISEIVYQDFESFRDSYREEIVLIVSNDPDFALNNLEFINSFYQRVCKNFIELGWAQYICENCSQEYFTKAAHAGRCPQCRSAKEFLDYGKRNRLVEHSELAGQAETFFAEKGYRRQSSFPMIPAQGNTIFTVAGVQCMNPQIFDDIEVEQTQSFILQPSIRLQTMDDTSSYPGCSTAFVNAVTIDPNADLESHLKHFNNWLEFLSNSGIYIGNLSAKIRIDQQNWGLGGVINMNIDLYYGGMSLFNASYFHDMPTASGERLNISDMGITVERTLWMLNKNPSYFDNIGPYEMSLIENNNAADAIRTITLMVGSGIAVDSKKGADRMRSKKLRALAKKFTSLKGQINIDRAVEHFYLYWSHYIDLPIEIEEVKRVVQSEYQRRSNLEIIRQLGTNKLRNCADRTTDEFIKMLINEKVATREQIAELFNH